MNYPQAVHYLQSLSDVERTRHDSAPPPRFNLERVRMLLELAGNPHHKYPSVHIAGTKGKGSTAAMLSSALRAAGYSVGLFTSPHLHSILERISINGASVASDEFAELVTRLALLADRVQQEHRELGDLTTFEVTTAVALLAFAERQVEFAVLETGMGGRLDATNVVDPVAAIITSVSLDHTSFLGPTLSGIAREKAGIIKSGRPLISAPQDTVVAEVLHQACQERDADLIQVGGDVLWRAVESDGRNMVSVQGRLGNYKEMLLPLSGEHQAENAAVAVATLEVLREQGYAITESHIRDGLETVWWPGRLETIAWQPRVVADGAHNANSFQRLIVALRDNYKYQRLLVVMGASADKDVAEMVRLLAPMADTFVATCSSHPRSTKPQVIAAEAAKCGVVALEAPDVARALLIAQEQATECDLICVTGSLFIVAEAREAMGLASATERVGVGSIYGGSLV